MAKLTPFLAACLMIAAPCLAQGQSADEAPAGGQEAQRRALRQVGDVCIEETRQFCPSLVSASASPTDTVTCLKVFRSSLSLACRHAVAAAAKVPDNSP